MERVIPQLTILVILCASVQAEVLFEDNFDDHSDWSPVQNPHGGGSTSSIDGDWDTRCTGCPDGTAIWAGYRIDSSAWTDYAGNSAIIDNSNYRGSSGKGLTFWYEPIDSVYCDGGTYWCSDQIVAARMENPQDEVYIRHFIKFQPDWIWATNPPPSMKMNHFTHYDGSGSYWTFFKSGNHWPIAVNTFGIGEGYTDAALNAHVRKQSCYYPNDGYDDWTGDGEIVANDFKRLGFPDDEETTTCTHNVDCKDWDEVLLDGNWHCLEYRLKGNTAEGMHDGIWEMWVDGVKVYSLTHIPWADRGEDATGDNKCSDCLTGVDPPSGFQGWNMIMFGGNQYNRYYPSDSHAEQWYAIDDVVISTEYVGPDYVIGDEPTCTSDNDCPGITPYCNTGTNMCVECLQANHCDDSNECTTDGCSSHRCSHSPTNNGQLCRGYDCRECNNGHCSYDDNTRCNAGDTCISGTCISPTPCSDNDNDDFGTEGSDLSQCSGSTTQADCNDDDSLISPGTAEICDNLQDDDCDNLIDCSDSGCFGHANCPEPEICEDIVLLLHFDLDSSDPQDSSGHENHGSVAGATWTSLGRFNGAFSFDGIDDIITVPHDTSLDLPNSGGAVSAWIRMDLANLGQDSYFPVIRKLDSSNEAVQSGYNLHFYQGVPTSSPYLRGVLGSPDEDTLLSANTAITDTNWHQAVLTWDSSTTYLYLDGEEEASMTRTQTLTWNQNREIIIGKHVPWFIAYSDGVIDEIAIWNRLLTPQEIQEIYNSGQAISCQDYHPADTDESGDISIGELIAYIDRWIDGDVSLSQVMEAIVVWKG